ncbi:ubiquitin-conjugating enzyme E2 1 [Trichinella spiralis]|uniref:ubiquitin-conjugating enzyme E2 1 n=1 Tax=Trichinella spiralis TaxID=6334 RepID=UPI0001EFD540|nr:ubiquitin-conjugating enzyme E2 1 [Trichinella spiralis]
MYSVVELEHPLNAIHSNIEIILKVLQHLKYRKIVVNNTELYVISTKNRCVYFIANIPLICCKCLLSHAVNFFDYSLKLEQNNMSELLLGPQRCALNFIAVYCHRWLLSRVGAICRLSLLNASVYGHCSSVAVIETLDTG